MKNVDLDIVKKRRRALERENTELRIQNARYEKRQNLWAEELEQVKTENARLRAQLEWTPIERELPEKSGEYLVTRQYSLIGKKNVRRVEKAQYAFTYGFLCELGEEILAWRELPQAWEGE